MAGFQSDALFSVGFGTLVSFVVLLGLILGSGISYAWPRAAGAPLIAVLSGIVVWTFSTSGWWQAAGACAIMTGVFTASFMTWLRWNSQRMVNGGDRGLRADP